MSKFFQGFEEEKSESKKKSVQISERNQEKLSKKEMKLGELKSKVEEVQNSGKSFDKLFKKLMNEAKKYAPYFENGEVPDFFSEFLNGQRVASSKQMSAQAQEFLNGFSKSQESATVGKKESRKREKTLETIMSIEDDKDKEKDLRDFLYKNEDKSEEIRCEILVALFSIYSRGQNPDSMIETLESISKYLELDNTFTRIVKKNLDIYLGKIYDLMNDKIAEKYSQLLSNLQGFNQAAVQKRFLEMQFFWLDNPVENDDPLFSLLFSVRNEDWADASAYFRTHEAVFDDSKISILILFEFAGLAAKHKEFNLAFEVFSRCDSTPFVSSKIEIYALCTILNEKLIGNPCFQSFLGIFKKFDTNYLALPSKDPVMEICRAFYLLNICDHMNASNIINKVSGFECREALLGCASRIFDRRR